MRWKCCSTRPRIYTIAPPWNAAWKNWWTRFIIDQDRTRVQPTEEQVSFDKAPLDDILDMTFPIDPSLRGKVREQVRMTVSQLPLDERDAVVSFINFFSSTKGRRILLGGMQRSGRYKAMISSRILAEEGCTDALLMAPSYLCLFTRMDSWLHSCNTTNPRSRARVLDWSHWADRSCFACFGPSFGSCWRPLAVALWNIFLPAESGWCVAFPAATRQTGCSGPVRYHWFIVLFGSGFTLLQACGQLLAGAAEVQAAVGTWA